MRTPPRTQVRRRRQDGGRSTVTPPLTGGCARIFPSPPPTFPGCCARTFGRGPGAAARGCRRAPTETGRGGPGWPALGLGASPLPSRPSAHACLSEQASPERTDPGALLHAHQPPAPPRGARGEEGGCGMSSRGARPPYPDRDQDLVAPRTLPYLGLHGLVVGGKASLTGKAERLPSPATLVCVGLGSGGSPRAMRAAGSLRLQPRTRGPLPQSVAHVGWESMRGRDYLRASVNSGQRSGVTLGQSVGKCWETVMTPGVNSSSFLDCS